MPGTFARDALAPNILAGATLNAAGTTNGTVVDLSAEGGDILWELVLSTVTSTGNTATATIHIDAAPVVGMTGAVRVASFVATGTDAAQSGDTLRVSSFIPPHGRFVRATVILGGTAPVYTGATLTPRTLHDRRKDTDTAAVV